MLRLFAAVGFFFIVSCAGAPQSGDLEPGIGEDGGMCGGIAGFQCKAEGSYCRVEPGACRNTADYAGVCTVKPEACTKDYRPVCGCNGETYGNACTAAAAGASIAHDGVCKED